MQVHFWTVYMTSLDYLPLTDKSVSIFKKNDAQGKITQTKANQISTVPICAVILLNFDH